ncbi:hypothetical protein FVEG_16230 [Fusarium verticillioides 7600]|uniref:Uncharacterized protein n=1 Tax=Gibberella moniliformis (strain M3125 / FGSC 7600) TaxID=334819 RepID=W7MAJ9_GIBM7|nr:hypothetical protein FVEG_16230 [Fusarium verticillioides 7600]EWG48036.1 hypothetical protein FVEG_16230 [Fusarium verticillioides 7600]
MLVTEGTRSSLIDESKHKHKRTSTKGSQVEEGVYEAFEGLWARVSMAFERPGQGSSRVGLTSPHEEPG